MSRKNKIFIAAVILFIALFSALSVMVSMFGKGFIERKAGELFGAETSVDSLSLSIPLTINIRGIQIGRLFRADNIYFSPGILSLFAGRLLLENLRIVNPVLNIQTDADGRLNFPGSPAAGKGAKKSKGPPFFPAALNIKNGKLVFTDKKIMPQGYQTVIEGVNIDISKTMLPVSLNIKFRFEGRLADRGERALGAIYGSGWIDFGPKDMDGALEIREVEITHFAPYYGNFLSSRKLSSAKLSALSEFKAKDNDLEINTRLKLHDLIYARDKAAEKISPASIFELAQKTLDLFLDSEGNLSLKFSIHTRLDKPRLTVADLKGLILQAAIESLSSQSPAELIRKGGQLLEQFKDFGEAVGDLF